MLGRRLPLWAELKRLLPLLRLTEKEIAYFALKVRMSTKARPEAGTTTRARRTRTVVAIGAAAKAARLRQTCAPFAGGIAFMDHSDDGIRKLVERAGLPWEEPEKRRLTSSERLLVGLLTLAFVLVNWAGVQRALVAGSDPVDLELAQGRFVAGSGCFARFLAQALLERDTWHGLFVTGDVSFLRMFACFAATRTGRPVSIYVRHRTDRLWVIPIAVDRLFTMDAGASENFDPQPTRVVLEAWSFRHRSIGHHASFDVGIVTDNFISVDHVWEVARECASHNNVRTVRIRLHPGSSVRGLPSGLPPSIKLEDNGESLATYAERIDVALVSMSSAVPVLQDLLVPCFHARRLYATDDLWGRQLPETTLESLGWRYPTPEVECPMVEFLDLMTTDALRLEVESLRRSTAASSSAVEISPASLKDELEAFLRS